MTDSLASTAAHAVAGSMTRHALGAVGSALVLHGWIDQGTANSAVSPIAEYLVGAGFSIAAAGWGAFRARATHWRWVRALYAPALPPPATRDPARP